jgi:hypothetical protein
MRQQHLTCKKVIEGKESYGLTFIARNWIAAVLLLIFMLAISLAEYFLMVGYFSMFSVM